MKTCRNCGKLLPLQEFYRHKQMADGHLNYCKQCVKDRVKRHRGNHLERIREYDRERGRLPHRKVLAAQVGKQWRKDHPGAVAAHSEVARAIAEGRLVKPKRCTVCGRKRKVVAHHPNYAMKLHVVWCCHPCHKKIEKLDNP